MTKTISRSRYLQALGLFTLAQRAYRQSREYEAGMGEVLGLPDEGGVYFGVVSDAISNDEDFDRALKRAGLVVAAPKGVQR